MAEVEIGSSAEQRGVVVKFDADRGFGFIRPDGATDQTTRDVFVHVSEVSRRRNLHPGQSVRYRVKLTDKGAVAVAVQPGSVLTIPSLKYGLLGLGVAVAILIGAGLWFGWPSTPGLWLAAWMLSASVACFTLFGFDKTRAQRGGERVPEVVLKGMSVLGGWPGGYVGMRVFHHKTQVKGFLSAYWPVYLLEVGVLAFLLLRF
jgi:uncharacterized membrane protein YsdA (DUF1294 family)/cold shock CspA family protein